MFIKGKTALVTGAAKGIGLECVKELLKNGAQVSYIG
jgi:NAD(P)-dependent dehydrogenase (short-subunit alcohol dehydrogenase family)